MAGLSADLALSSSSTVFVRLDEEKVRFYAVHFGTALLVLRNWLNLAEMLCLEDIHSA